MNIGMRQQYSEEIATANEPRWRAREGSGTPGVAPVLLSIFQNPVTLTFQGSGIGTLMRPHFILRRESLSKMLDYSIPIPTSLQLNCQSPSYKLNGEEEISLINLEPQAVQRVGIFFSF